MRTLRSRFAAGLLFACLLLPGAGHSQNFVNFEGKQTHPVRLSPDGTRLFAVNTPDGRVSVFDVTQASHPRLIAEIPVGLEPVSVNPRTADQAWVVNEVSDSISVVSVSRGIVIDTLPAKDEPVDVVFAGGKAFVSASRSNRILVFDAASRTLVTNLAVLGENPRALAVNTNGTKVYAAFALSGNRTTIVPADKAPPQPPPTGVTAPPPQVGLIVDVADTNYTLPRTNIIQFKMPDNDVVEIDVATLAIRYYTNVGTVNLGMAVRPGSGELFVAGTDARNLTRFENVLNGVFLTNQVSRIQPGTGVVTRHDLNPGFLTNISSAAFRSNSLAQPTDLVFEPDGASYFLAAFGSDRVARLSATQPGQVLSQVELSPTGAGAGADPRQKRGPRGLALMAASQRLYVLNRIANSISIIDTATDKLLKEIPVGSHDPTPDIIRQGRGFLYDTKLSGNGTVSCASCHIDADMDSIAWDLGDPTGSLTTNRSVLPIPTPPFFLTNISVFHPMKGPMTTQTLRGLKGQDPLHWRGDRTNFTHFNGAFTSLLGGSALSQADMNAFRDFINTVTYAPNPNQNLDRTYPTNFAGGNAEAGRIAYMFTNYAGGLTCHNCHTAPPGTGSNGLIIPANALQESQDFKVPHLRNIYQKLGFDNAPGANSRAGFGLIHDGIDSTLQGFLSRAVFTNIRNNTAIKNNLSAFVQCFDTGLAPAVGYGRTVSTNNVAAPAVTADWALLESQAAATNIDLVVRGTVDGVRRGFVYRPVSGAYAPDTATLPTFTRAQLTSKIQGGDTLTLLGVPPGSGQRLGIDRNLDGVLDADTPAPTLQIARTGNNLIVDWPLAAAGFDLESTPGLSPAAWQSAPEPWEILGGRNYVTNASGDANRLFRLNRKNAP